MNLDKKVVLAIVLGVVAVGVVLFQMRSLLPSGSRVLPTSVTAPKTASTAKPSTTQVARAVTEAPYAGYIAGIKESDILYDKGSFRNPMTPLFGKRSGKKNWKDFITPITQISASDGPTDASSLGYTLDGVVWNENDPLALVNDEVVGVGESLVDGSYITQITRDTVKFTKDGKEFFLAYREE